MTLVYTVRRSQFSTPGTADTSPPRTFTSKLKSGMSTSAICRDTRQQTSPSCSLCLQHRSPSLHSVLGCKLKSGTSVTVMSLTETSWHALKSMAIVSACHCLPAAAQRTKKKKKRTGAARLHGRHDGQLVHERLERDAHAAAEDERRQAHAQRLHQGKRGEEKKGCRAPAWPPRWAACS